MPITVSPNAQGSESLLANSPSPGSHYGTIFHNDNKVNPMQCGIFTMKEAEPIAANYPCSEFNIILEGEFCVEDKANPGKQVVLKAGDVVRVDKGTSVKWSCPTQGKVFFVVQLGEDDAFEKHVVEF